MEKSTPQPTRARSSRAVINLARCALASFLLERHLANLPSCHRHIEIPPSPLLHDSFPLSLSPECCRQHGELPQWHCVVSYRHLSEKCPFPDANIIISQTIGSSSTVSCRIHGLPLVHLFEFSDTNAETRSCCWKPWYATTDENRATRSTIAESGREEGSYAICFVCLEVPRQEC